MPNAAHLTLVRRPLASSSRLDDAIVPALARRLQFKTFLAIAIAADLLDDLHAPGPITVIAPTDEAFEALGEAFLRDLMRPQAVEALVDLAESFVAIGAPARAMTTLFGTRVRVDAKGNIGHARVIERMRCRNGTVLVVDAVVRT